MKTTINIPDSLFRELKREAAQSRKTISALVIESLRERLSRKREPVEVTPLPTFKCGAPKVNVADRDELFRAMERG